MDILHYFSANKEGLLPYQKRGFEIPESPKGLIYKNMGTMENHIWSIIARRMKHNHTSWSIKGGNHLAKTLVSFIWEYMKLPEEVRKKVKAEMDEIREHCRDMHLEENLCGFSFIYNEGYTNVENLGELLCHNNRKFEAAYYNF